MQAQNKVEQTTNREALWIGENKTNAFYFRWKVTTSVYFTRSHCTYVNEHTTA